MTTFAHFGLAEATWSSYQTVANHIQRCEDHTGKDLSLPFTLEKTLTLVAWMIEERNLKSKIIDKYLSGLRMVHLSEGLDLPCLREPIVKLTLSGKHNWDSVKEKIGGNSNKRDPITFDMMKLFKKKLLTINWTVKKKILFHAVSTLACNGSFRIYELLSRDAKSFDSTVTLMQRH